MESKDTIARRARRLEIESFGWYHCGSPPSYCLHIYGAIGKGKISQEDIGRKVMSPLKSLETHWWIGRDRDKLDSPLPTGRKRPTPTTTLTLEKAQSHKNVKKDKDDPIPTPPIPPSNLPAFT